MFFGGDFEQVQEVEGISSCIWGDPPEPWPGQGVAGAGVWDEEELGIS